MGRRRWMCAALAIGTIAVGLVWRMAPLGLPTFWWKYGGSLLWAAMVYWLVAAILEHRQVWTVAGVAFGIAVTVEMFKLLPGARLDTFRMTLAGKLLLGRFFSLWDLAAYAIAITATACADSLIGVRHPSQDKSARSSLG